MPLFGGAFSVGKPAKGVEDFLAVEFAFLFAHAGNLAEFGDGARLGLADEIECSVVQNDEGGDHLSWAVFLRHSRRNSRSSSLT